MRVVICFVLTVGLSALLASCGGDSDGGGSGNNGGGTGDAEGVARKAIQALIDDQWQDYLNTVRPDRLTEVGSDAQSYYVPPLDGCSLDGAKALTEQTGISDVTVTFVFTNPCGSDVYGRAEENGHTNKCAVSLTSLSGDWYVDPRASSGPRCGR